jgi:predicted nucleic-acid-binding protein
MIAVDTNILIRLLTNDDHVQYAKAKKLLNHSLVFIPETVLQECEWVLRYTYGFSRKWIFDGLNGVLGLDNVTVARPAVVYNTLSWFQNGMDFADALHLAGSSHCEKLATFDRAFIKSAKECSPCAVSLP